ncbi:MAG: twin-arginine translocase TatA/TatE family subunit [Ignavibacteriales bacterium]
MFGNLGAGEIIVILLVILIFFGPKKIPEIAQGIGKGMREFKKAMRDVEDELKTTDSKPSAPKSLEPKSEGVKMPDNLETPEKSPEVKS